MRRIGHLPSNINQLGYHERYASGWMMHRVRVIPSLLMERGGLVKTVQFGTFPVSPVSCCHDVAAEATPFIRQSAELRNSAFCILSAEL